MALSERHLFAFKAETTYGQDAFNGSEPSDFIAVLGDPEINETYITVESEEKTAVHSGRPDIRYGEKTELSFAVPLLGKEALAGDPPPMLDALFTASNCEETSTASDVSYKPVTGADMNRTPSMTVVHYMRDDESGNFYKRTVTGVRGNFSLNLSEDSDIRIEFSGSGLFSKMTTSASAISGNPTVYNGGKNRMTVQGAVFKYGGTEYPMTNAQLNSNWAIGEDKTSSGTEAVDLVYLYRDSRATMDVTLKGRSSVITDITPLASSGAVGEVIIEMTNGGDTITVTCPAVQVAQYSKSVVNGRVDFDFPLLLNGKWDGTSLAGENDWEIKFA